MQRKVIPEAELPVWMNQQLHQNPNYKDCQFTSFTRFAGSNEKGCTNLKQKQDIVHVLTKVGISQAFVAAVDDFVAGESIKKYFPTEDEENEILVKIKEKRLIDEALYS